MRRRTRWQSAREAFAAVRRRRAWCCELSGAPEFAVDSRAQIQGETKALALTGTHRDGRRCCWWRSRRCARSAAAMLPVATGVVAGMAAVSLVFGGVHGMTLGFGTTLIGEAVDYAIYYLIQARGSGSGRSTRLAPLAARGLAHRAAGPADVGVRLSRAGVLGLSRAGAARRVLDRRPDRRRAGHALRAAVCAARTAHRGVGLRRHLGRWAAACSCA